MEEIIKGIAIGVGTTLILTIITVGYKSCNHMKDIEKGYEKVSEQHNLLFKSVLAIFEVLRNGKVNGNVQGIEDEIQEYLRKTATDL